jgi:hypothetical protein
MMTSIFSFLQISRIHIQVLGSAARGTFIAKVSRMDAGASGLISVVTTLSTPTASLIYFDVQITFTSRGELKHSFKTQNHLYNIFYGCDATTSFSALAIVSNLPRHLRIKRQGFRLCNCNCDLGNCLAAVTVCLLKKRLILQGIGP